MQQHDYDTPEGLRSFLALCLDPGHGIKRTPDRLAEVLPEALASKAAEFAPHLGRLRHEAKAADQRAKEAHRAYAEALASWIHGEEPTQVPRRSMPLLKAVSAVYDAAVSHAARCSTCGPNMGFAEMCDEGARTVIAALDEPATQPFTAEEAAAAPADAAASDVEASDDPECAHVAWEVTSEFRNSNNLWVKSRRCTDCGQPMQPTYDVEPHWPDKAVATCPGFEKEHQGDSDAKRRPANCKYCRQPQDQHRM
ncbi:hypothetical protein [Streptomyces sp. NPDC004728]|uniref:hypothetical protein n=1 Tax=Streptomyces sp. NPDC004728 TaxID=3154289 RepID=UPI0033A72027